MQLPIPDDWLGVDFCTWAVCWPDSPKWRAVLHGLLEQPSQGRLWDFSTGNFLSMRNSFRTAYDYNFDLKEVIMACGDTGLETGLAAIAAAIAQLAAAQSTANLVASGCCSDQIAAGNGGVVRYIPYGDEGELMPVFGTQPPLGVVPGEWPEGYGSRDEYDLDKCQIANLIVEGLRQTLLNFGALNAASVGASLGALLISLVAPSILFPPAAVAAVVVALLVSVAVAATCADFANEIESNRQDWVCALYVSDTADIALSAVSNLVDLVVTGLALAAPIGNAVRLIVLTIVNGDTINQLFEKKAHADYPGADCAACEAMGECWNFDDDAEGWEAIESVNGFGYGDATVEWGAPGMLKVFSGTGNGEAPGSFGVCIATPAFSRVVSEGDQVGRFLADYPGGAFNNYVWVEISGSWVPLQVVTANIATCDFISLDGYIGETVTRIAFEWNRGGSGFEIDVDYAGYNCPDC